MSHWEGLGRTGKDCEIPGTHQDSQSNSTSSSKFSQSLVQKVTWTYRRFTSGPHMCTCILHTYTHLHTHRHTHLYTHTYADTPTCMYTPLNTHAQNDSFLRPFRRSQIKAFHKSSKSEGRIIDHTLSSNRSHEELPIWHRSANPSNSTAKTDSTEERRLCF